MSVQERPGIIWSPCSPLLRHTVYLKTRQKNTLKMYSLFWVQLTFISQNIFKIGFFCPQALLTGQYRVKRAKQRGKYSVLLVPGVRLTKLRLGLCPAAAILSRLSAHDVQNIFKIICALTSLNHWSAIVQKMCLFVFLAFVLDKTLQNYTNVTTRLWLL